MEVTSRFHSEALSEFAEATYYYLRHATARVARRFSADVKSAVHSIVASPTRWPGADDPPIRRYVLKRFPFVPYYLWKAENREVVIIAVMHSHREPGYWRERVPRS